MHDGRLRYLSTSRMGTSAARNLGIAASHGDLIAFTDDDVEASPDWLALIVDEFTADPDLQLLCGALVAPPHDYAKGFVPEFRPSPDINAWQLPLVASNANMSMRRSFFDHVGCYDELCGPGGLLKSSDDGDITLRAMRAGVKWKVSPSIEVLHTHGFRPREAADRLLEDYEYGNGAIFGRALRRGDLVAGGWFALRELRQLAHGLCASGRSDLVRWRQSIRLRGFWHGLCLPPAQGMVSAHELRKGVGYPQVDTVV
jgi:glycosyltransferase involved in cell wall biosynthesis